MVDKMTLKITINRLKNPMLAADYISSPTKTNSMSYRAITESMQRTISKLNVILTNLERAREAEMHREQVSATQQVAQAVSNVQASDPYDELMKLKQLLDMGVITQEEFEIKKTQLLGL